ncbi:MAG: amino acid permease [Deltaproteobacteria bacterium]|nr:amino acid permease [Deltaproteobacteria bacterium]
MSGDRDESDLSELGYMQELSRELGAFQNFALSFSIISVLTGAVTLYGHGLTWGGPFVMLAGWPLVALFTIAIALSLGELASAFPTAGALYHWASLLGGPGAGWATAWLNTLGQFAITAGIDYGLAEFLAPLLGWPADRAHVLPLYGAVLASHAALNHVGLRWVARLNTVSAWYHLLGVLALLGGVLGFAPRQPLSFLLERRAPLGVGVGAGFFVALLQAGWTFTGYDASAHASEETHDAAENAPRGILTSVVASAVAGYAMLLAVTLAIGDLEAATSAPNPFIFVLEHALGRLGTALVWLAVGAMWFCGLASITSNSRMLYAFARDGGLPFSRAIARVSPKYRSPHVAVWVSAAMAFVVSIWAEVYTVMVALSVVALYASYAIPVAFGWWRRRRGWPRVGPFALGRASGAVNALALAWLVFMVLLMSLPPNGLAGATFLATLLVLALAWWGGVRRVFKGPEALGSRSD